MTYENSRAQPPYAPNSYGGPMADPARGSERTWAGEAAEIQRAANVKHADDDDFGQAGTLYRETMDEAGRESLLNATVGHAGAPEVTDMIKGRVVAYWSGVDADLGQKVADGLGVARDEQATAKVAEMAGRA
jgi:catalase